MLETRQGDKYIKEFHDAHPDTIVVECVPSGPTVGDMWELAAWAKENIFADALITKSDKFNKDGNFYMFLLYCTDEADAMAAKLRWSE